MKLLSDHRRDLVMQRTRICCQVRWFLHELDPDLEVASRGLRHQALVTQLLTRLDEVDGVVARLARELLERCRELTARSCCWSTSCGPGPPARALAADHSGLRGALGRADRG